jgi:hypothetical protein
MQVYQTPESSIPFEEFRRNARIYIRLRTVSILLAIAIICYQLILAENALTGISAMLITIFATLPLLIWCTKNIRGLPIFPLFAISFIWSYATPLVINHPVVVLYSPEQHFTAAITIVCFLALSTLTWLFGYRLAPASPKYFYGFDKKRYKGILISALLIAILISLAPHAYWIPGLSYISGSLFLAFEIISSLAIFILGYLYGSNNLTLFQKQCYLFLLLILCLIQALGLILFAPVAKIVIALIAITLGRKRPPILLASILLPMFIILHFGKYEMRAKYWSSSHAPRSITSMPSEFIEWYGYSFQFLFSPHPTDIASLSPESTPTRKRRFIERVSLMHMFLEVVKRTGEDVPMLNGKSYAVIPTALLPRLLYPAKTSAHEALALINIHYGHQTREQTKTTHIAWGLLAEAWANYGFLSFIPLAVLMGVFTGAIAGWSHGLPLFSFRVCFAALLASILLNATTGTLATVVISIIHSFVVLVGIRLLLMKKRPVI